MLRVPHLLVLCVILFGCATDPRSQFLDKPKAYVEYERLARDRFDYDDPSVADEAVSRIEEQLVLLRKAREQFESSSAAGSDAAQTMVRNIDHKIPELEARRARYSEAGQEYRAERTRLKSSLTSVLESSAAPISVYEDALATFETEFPDAKEAWRYTRILEGRKREQRRAQMKSTLTNATTTNTEYALTLAQFRSEFSDDPDLSAFVVEHAARTGREFDALLERARGQRASAQFAAAVDSISRAASLGIEPDRLEIARAELLTSIVDHVRSHLDAENFDVAATHAQLARRVAPLDKTLTNLAAEHRRMGLAHLESGELRRAFLELRKVQCLGAPAGESADLESRLRSAYRNEGCGSLIKDRQELEWAYPALGVSLEGALLGSHALTEGEVFDATLRIDQRFEPSRYEARVRGSTVTFVVESADALPVGPRSVVPVRLQFQGYESFARGESTESLPIFCVRAMTQELR